MDKEKIQERLRGNPTFYILQTPMNQPQFQLNWNRYLPFIQHGSQWVPYHKTYTALWAAKKYPNWWYGDKRDQFIMDLTNGSVVYKNWENEDE